MTAQILRSAVRDLLVSSLRRRRPEAIRLLAWSLLEALPAYLSGWLVARAVDHGFLAGREATGFAWLAALTLSIVVGSWATRETYRWLAALVEPFRDELTTLTVTGALQRSTLPGAVPDAAGVARVTQQVEFVRESYATVLFVTQGFLVTTVSALIGVLTLLPAVLVFVLPPLLVGLSLFGALLPRMAACQQASILADERIAESTSAMASGFRDVIACGGEKAVVAAIGDHIDAHARATTALARLTAVRSAAVAIGGWLPIVLILLGASWLRHRGATTGIILGALTYVLQGIQPPLQTLARGLGGTGLWLLVTLRRIVEATTLPAVSGRSRDTGSRAAPSHHALRFAQVSFRYGQSPEPVLRDFDLGVPEGGHLAVVGPSGIGKSTLANLIAGMLAPDAGALYMGAIPLDGIDAGAYGRNRVLIPQEAYVFAGTLGENLSYLRTDVSAPELDRAVALLGAEALVRRLGGYAAELRPEMLSAGERQLVTLVRAYVAGARIVVLDEATCHLDAGLEARVERAFAEQPGTLIVVAHRISSALRAERILLLDGRRALLGTHQGLLHSSSLYRDLVGQWESGAPTATTGASRSSAN